MLSIRRHTTKRPIVGIYKIGDQMINLYRLVAIGEVYTYEDNYLGIPLFFEGNTALVAKFRDGAKDILGYAFDERLKLIEAWTK